MLVPSTVSTQLNKEAGGSEPASADLVEQQSCSLPWVQGKLHLGLWHVAQPDELRAPSSACAITPSLPSLPRGSAARLPQPGPAAALWGRPRASSARAGAVPVPSALPLAAAPRQHRAAGTALQHWELSQHPWVIPREHGKG